MKIILYFGQGNRRLDIYTEANPDRPSVILLVDPTDLTVPLNRIDKGSKCPGLEKWICAELAG